MTKRGLPSVRPTAGSSLPCGKYIGSAYSIRCKIQNSVTTLLRSSTSSASSAFQSILLRILPRVSHLFLGFRFPMAMALLLLFLPHSRSRLLALRNVRKSQYSELFS